MSTVDITMRLREALKEIAGEQKVYTGHGDYDVLPALDADQAQALARRALMSGNQQSQQ